MRIFKKTFIAASALSLMLGLAACGDGKEKASTAAGQTEANTETEAVTEPGTGTDSGAGVDLASADIAPVEGKNVTEDEKAAIYSYYENNETALAEEFKQAVESNKSIEGKDAIFIECYRLIAAEYEEKIASIDEFVVDTGTKGEYSIAVTLENGDLASLQIINNNGKLEAGMGSYKQADKK